MKLKNNFQQLLNDQNIDIKIKPCPCCESNEIDLIYVNTGAEVYHVVECHNCKTHIHTQLKDIIEIADIWNKN